MQDCVRKNISYTVRCISHFPKGNISHCEAIYRSSPQAPPYAFREVSRKAFLLRCGSSSPKSNSAFRGPLLHEYHSYSKKKLSHCEAIYHPFCDMSTPLTRYATRDILRAICDKSCALSRKRCAFGSYICALSVLRAYTRPSVRTP